MAYMGIVWRLGIIGFITWLLGACSSPESTESKIKYHKAQQDTLKTYILIPHPLYNPQKLFEVMQPMVDYINQRLAGARIELEASQDYQCFESKMSSRHGDFLMPNPWQTLEAMRYGYHVIAMWGAPEDFKGLIITRKDSQLKSPQDMKGKVFSSPSHTALAAAILPQNFFYTHGLRYTDYQSKYVGTQESSILSVYMKESDAGGTWPPSWRMFQKSYPQQAKELEVRWETPPLINGSFMARGDVKEEHQKQVKDILLEMAHDPAGIKILEGMTTTPFFPASDIDYNVVKIFAEKFEKNVRQVSNP